MMENGVPCAMITGTTVTPGKNIGIAGEDRGEKRWNVCYLSMDHYQRFFCRSM